MRFLNPNVLTDNALIIIATVNTASMLLMIARRYVTRASLTANRMQENLKRHVKVITHLATLWYANSPKVFMDDLGF